MKDARVLQSCMSEGSLLNSIHSLYLRALLLTHKFCLGTYNLFALLYLVFLVDISDWYVKRSFVMWVLDYANFHRYCNILCFIMPKKPYKSNIVMFYDIIFILLTYSVNHDYDVT